MATRSPGQNKKSCQVWLDQKVKAELEALAKKSDMKLHEYCVTVLTDAVLNGALMAAGSQVSIARINSEPKPRKLFEVSGGGGLMAPVEIGPSSARPDALDLLRRAAQGKPAPAPSV